MAMQKPKNSQRSKLKKRLSEIYKELSAPVRKGSKSLGTTLSSDFTPSGKNRKGLQKEFDKVSAQLKKISGGAAATRKAAPALKTSPAKKTAAAKKQTFSEAFAAARKAGKKQFMFNGKPYNTRTKEEEAARKKKATLKKTVAKTGAESRKLSDKKKRRAAGKYVGPRQDMVDKLSKKSYGGGMTKKKTVKRQGGGSMKPKGVGCAMRGYGGAMKKS